MKNQKLKILLGIGLFTFSLAGWMSLNIAEAVEEQQLTTLCSVCGGESPCNQTTCEKVGGCRRNSGQCIDDKPEINHCLYPDSMPYNTDGFLPLGILWEVEGTGEVHYSTEPEACGFYCVEHATFDEVNQKCECNTGYYQSGQLCSLATIETDFSCIGDLDNTSAHAVGDDKPKKPMSRTFDADKTGGECKYLCNDGYEYKGGVKSDLTIGCEKIETEVPCFFCQFHVEKILKLTADHWNNIMDKLDTVFKFNGDNVTVNYETIPAGAIMAFNLTECPEGWTRFANADGRFLMGASTYGDLGGKTSVTLGLGNIPFHQHYMFGPYTAIGVDLPGADDDSKLDDDATRQKVNKQTFDGYISYYNEDFNHDDDDEQYIMRSYSEPGAYKGDSSYHRTEPMKGLTSGPKGLTTTSSFDILNPYIKVLYCVKQ